MNIFILHSDAKENAKLYCDRHLVKMILESVQILCSVSHMRGVGAPYKLTHQNHPSVQWVNQSEAHWDMLVNMVEELNNEYKFRYNKTHNHKSYNIMKGLIKPKFERKDPTGKFIAVTDNVAIVGLVECIKKYREYYISKNKEMQMKYTKRNFPNFLKK